MPATDSVPRPPRWHFEEGFVGAGLHSSTWTQQQFWTFTEYVPFSVGVAVAVTLCGSPPGGPPAPAQVRARVNASALAGRSNAATARHPRTTIEHVRLMTPPLRARCAETRQTCSLRSRSVRPDATDFPTAEEGGDPTGSK